MLFLIIGLLVGGLIVGALGRLVVPGPNPIGIWATIGCGIGGSLLGGLVGRLVLGWRYRYSGILGLAIAVGFTAILVALISHERFGPRRRF